ncbi:MAG: hypothetical protein Q7S82_03510 [bacterium]|nr:hypothetical protein [bacterium]
MKNIWLSILAIIAILTGGWYVYVAKGGPSIPFDALTHGLMALIAVYVFGKIREAYKRTQNITYKYLSYFIFGWIIAGFSVAIGNFYFFDNPFLFGWAFAIAVLALFPAAAYFVRIPFNLKNAFGLEKLAFWAVLAVGAVIIGMSVLNFPQPFVNESGFTQFNSPLPALLGTLPFTAYALVTGLLALFFFVEAGRTKEKLVRMRSVFIGVGTLLSVGLGFHIFGGGLLSSWGELSVAVGFLAILAGVLYKD